MMWSMKRYSEDLRKRIVEAVQEGVAKSRVAGPFGVSFSSVKRYARMVARGSSLEPRKGGGRPSKTDSIIRKLLEGDAKERSAVTVAQRRRFLQSASGKALSDSTVLWRLKKMGFSQKTNRGGDGTERVGRSCLESDGGKRDRSTAADVRGRDGS
jgi:transposase